MGIEAKKIKEPQPSLQQQEGWGWNQGAKNSRAWNQKMPKARKCNRAV
jgi:hypothetical protein